MAGMRRSEVSALRWADVVDATDGDGVLVTVRRSKTNQEGETNDIRFVKDGVARAIRTLRASMSPESGDRVVPLSAQIIGLRFTAAAQAAGVESRVTAHSGRIGLASELTSRGASTTDVMLAGNWKTSRMVAHYSAGATAERGAGGSATGRGHGPGHRVLDHRGPASGGDRAARPRACHHAPHRAGAGGPGSLRRTTGRSGRRRWSSPICARRGRPPRNGVWPTSRWTVSRPCGRSASVTRSSRSCSTPPTTRST